LPPLSIEPRQRQAGVNDPGLRDTGGKGVEPVFRHEPRLDPDPPAGDPGPLQMCRDRLHRVH
jgi:hypothetical protein